MPVIHPSAIVDPQAELADDVVIGPGCVIEGPARIGCGTRLLAHVFTQGRVVLGQRNIIYPGVTLGYPPQDRKFGPESPSAGIVIGDDNILRENVTIHRSTADHPTRLGHNNMLMVNSHLGHDVTVGNNCVLVNGALVGGHASVGDNVTMGGGSAVHQFVRVGRLSMISGVTAISRDLPPFCTVYEIRKVGSLNLVGLRRAGFRENIEPLRRAFEILYRRNHTGAVAVKLIEDELGHDPLCREFANFIRTSKRGICSYIRASALED